MATALKLEPIEGEVVGNDIVVAVTQNPGLVLLDAQKFDAFYEKMKVETDKLVPDTSTAKGRDEIRSMAAKVTRTKAAIEAARLALTEEWRTKTKQANDAGKAIKDRLEALAGEVRKPLTEWEEAEKARVAECQAIIASFRTAAIVSIEDTSATVRERGKTVWETAVDPERFGDMADEATAAKEQAVAALKAALARLSQEEADRAELERLRAAAAERERIEAERLAAEEAERQRAEEARIAEERRLAAEKAEQERIERAQQEAAAAAAREAEEKARREQEERDRAHAEQLAAERRRAEEAERAAQAERDRVAAEEAERAAEAKRLADEQAAREANQKHRTAVKRAAKEAIMTCGVSKEAAQKIVLAIIAGEVPAVTLKF